MHRNRLASITIILMLSTSACGIQKDIVDNKPDKSVEDNVVSKDSAYYNKVDASKILDELNNKKEKINRLGNNLIRLEIANKEFTVPFKGKDFTDIGYIDSKNDPIKNNSISYGDIREHKDNVSNNFLVGYVNSGVDDLDRENSNISLVESLHDDVNFNILVGNDKINKGSKLNDIIDILDNNKINIDYNTGTLDEDLENTLVNLNNHTENYTTASLFYDKTSKEFILTIIDAIVDEYVTLEDDYIPKELVGKTLPMIGNITYVISGTKDEGVNFISFNYTEINANHLAFNYTFLEN